MIPLFIENYQKLIPRIKPKSSSHKNLLLKPTHSKNFSRLNVLSTKPKKKILINPLHSQKCTENPSNIILIAKKSTVSTKSLKLLPNTNIRLKSKKSYDSMLMKPPTKPLKKYSMVLSPDLYAERPRPGTHEKNKMPGRNYSRTNAIPSSRTQISPTSDLSSFSSDLLDQVPRYY